jgi:hypothetical protein
MKCFRDESPVQEIYSDDDESHWNLMLDNIFAGAGEVFLEDKKGLLIAATLPSIWGSKVLALHELAWYVKPEFRGGTTGYKLLKCYLEYAKELKQTGRIKYFTVSKMVSSPDIDYSRFGFRKVDENWVQ